MKKRLNIDGITSELTGGSAFFPGYKGGASPASNTEETPLPQTEPVASPPPEISAPTPKPAIPERSNARTPELIPGKRIITRNSFEIYEDQMDSLRRVAYQEKMEGKLGSMSAMVREAIDAYLKRKTSKM